MYAIRSYYGYCRKKSQIKGIHNAPRRLFKLAVGKVVAATKRRSKCCLWVGKYHAFQANFLLYLCARLHGDMLLPKWTNAYSVITSYSIHYTKLYDERHRLASQSLIGDASGAT